MALPEDALSEILLRLPAKDLCRLRGVCRAWRSLLSDRHFIAAHAACHPEPLVVVGYGTGRRDDGCDRDGRRVLLDIMDLSGRVIKRVHADSEHERVMCTTELGLICITKGSTRSCRLLNPATGAVHELPQGLAAEHAAHGLILDYYSASIALGLVASTGERKVLRVLEHIFHHGHPRQMYEVFTLDCRRRKRQACCWRAKKVPPYQCSVELGYRNSVVIDGIVYFLLSNGWDHNADKGLVASFDLETEEWSASIRGPLVRGEADGVVDVSGRRRMRLSNFSLAVLTGCVVLGYSRLRASNWSSADSPSIDLWFLMDFEKGLWVKQHSIEIGNLRGHHMVQPLLVLNDGRIVLDYIGDIGYVGHLKIYDPRSKNCTNLVKMDHRDVVGFYAGNILSLTNPY